MEKKGEKRRKKEKNGGEKKDRKSREYHVIFGL